MLHKQLFVTGLRLFGIWELLRLIDYVVEAYDLKVGFYKSSLTTIGGAYTHASTYLVVGLYLLGGAPHIVKFFYPPTTAASEETSKQAIPEA